jgi:putative ATPase
LSIEQAVAIVEQTGNLPVPLHLRNAPTKLMKDLGYHKGYKYAHDYDEHFVELQYLPDKLLKTRIWQMQDNPQENKMTEYVRKLWKGRY